MLDPALTNWRAQYHRLVRSYTRVIGPYTSQVAYDDDLQHYFQDCWHLKDWIANDPSSGIGPDIESEVAAHTVLRVVADLANGSKHLARRNNREGAYVTSISVTVHLGQERPIDVEYIVSLDDGTVVNGQALVRDSFAAWSAVLKKLGLS